MGANKTNRTYEWIGGIGFSGVGMESAEEKIDTEIGEENGEKRQQAIDMEHARATEEGQRACVKRSGIDEKRHQRPDLFGIPAPVASPRHIRPHRTEEDTDGQAAHRRSQEQKRERHQVLLSVGLGTQCHQTIEHDKRQEGVTEHDDTDMQAQERRLQHGCQVGNLRIGGRHHTDEKGHGGKEDS